MTRSMHQQAGAQVHAHILVLITTIRIRTHKDELTGLRHNMADDGSWAGQGTIYIHT